MYPNPQDVLPLPPRPDLEQYRRRSKDLVRACESGDERAFHEWASRWLADLARLDPSKAERAEGTQRRSEQLSSYAREQLTQSDCGLAQAQFVIARAHGFASWPRLVRHLEELSGPSPTSAFERAANAIAAGDLATLQRLLGEDPSLARARSSREHHATLLHYVSANGVENWRQRTPANIVAIASALLDAGSDVEAEADVYGGGAKTLGLTVTSTPPRQAGVQLALADLLLERGARVDAGIVRDCLANGCPEAAEHMANRGAPLGLEEAAGIGRVELMRRIVESGLELSAEEGHKALLMACWYGRLDAVRYLLDARVVPVGAADAEDGRTALHVAAYEGHRALAELLIDRGAPLDVTDRIYGTPPVVWALHAWLVENRDATRYREVVRLMIERGATVKPEWLDDERLDGLRP